MKKIISILLTLLSVNSYGGIFGPSNYEECVLDGLKNTKTESSVYLLRQTCQQKFQKDSEKKVINICSLTWNGKTFYPGRPEMIDKYTTITFKGTSDILFVPDNMIDSVTQSFILKEKDKIQTICPGINFDLQNIKNKP